MATFNLPNVTDDMSMEEMLSVVGKMKKTLEWVMYNLDSDNVPVIINIEEGVQQNAAGISSLTQDVNGNFSLINQEIDSIQLAVGNAQGDISAIELSVGQIQSTVIQHDTQLGTHASQITQNANQISQRVTYTDYTGDEIASRINQTATTILLQANRIKLDGVTHVADQLRIGNALSPGIINLYGDGQSGSWLFGSSLELAMGSSYDVFISQGSGRTITIGNTWASNTVNLRGTVQVNGVAIGSGGGTATFG